MVWITSTKGVLMIRPFLQIYYPDPLTREQEDILISYFQSWQYIFSTVFMKSSVSAQLINPELAKTLKMLAGDMNLMMRLEKSEPDQGYIFSFDDYLYSPAQIPLPAKILKKLKLTNEDRLGKLRDRMKKELIGEVAKKMGIRSEDIDILP